MLFLQDYESDFEEAPSPEMSSEEDTHDEFSKEEEEEDNEEDDDKENYDYGDSSSSLSDLQINKEVHSSPNGKAGIEEKKMDSGHYDLAEDRRLNRKAMGSVPDLANNIFRRENEPLEDTRFVKFYLYSPQINVTVLESCVFFCSFQPVAPGDRFGLF